MHRVIGRTNLERVKTILWAIMGVWVVVTVARFAHGMGATTGLTDVAPWGFWIAFDVMAGVALAAGGFVIAAAVYIFGMEKYHSLARPAILTALLGYIAVAVGLLYDLGIPWHIWHPMIFPQHHSVLFEVAMCVMLYLTVLSLEFSPVVLEHPLFHRPFFQKLLVLIKKLTIPLVIFGIVLSTLHQSSLGSLFLIQPFRVHPLWYSPIMYVLFFISAMALGLMMVTLEALVSAWLFGHRVRTDLLAGLGFLASIILPGYALLRIYDLWARGILPGALDGSWQAGLFLFELLVSAILPAILLALPRVRRSIPGLATCSVMVVLGVIGYRFNVCIVAFERPEGMAYWPTWTELGVSAGIVAAAALVFIFLNENLRIVEDHADGHGADPGTAPAEAHAAEVAEKVRSAAAAGLAGTFSPALRRHSLVFVIAGAVAIGCLPEDAVFGPSPRPVPVTASRNVEALATAGTAPLRRDFHVAGLAGNVPAAAEPAAVRLMIIDGNRDWRFVPFPHDDHITVLGGADSCRLCHHQNLSFDQQSSCASCHRDMYERTDTFDHGLHVYRLGANRSCAVCHGQESGRKSRSNALACWQCHGDMVVSGSIVPPHEELLVGYAPSYYEAMHGLCIRCHSQIAAREPVRYEHFDRCDVCHREFRDTDHRRMAPYVPMPPGHTQTTGMKPRSEPAPIPPIPLPPEAVE
ncbi:MAG: Ni/Fe-hydrogenase cytochrome b subunit [Phycisphaerales bacterium]|nr:Ni/Fe-hydrogenase cytochrome b subunit [Phycisphaerales bacterium]